MPDANGADLKRLQNWFGNYGRTGLIVVALIIYGLLRLPYSIYYGLLGTSPEEVGLGYVELLSQSIVAMMVPVLLLLYAGGVLWVARVAILIVSRGERRERALEPLRTVWTWRYRVSAAAIGFYLLLALPVVSAIEAGDARQGDASDVTRFGVLGLRADPVAVTWIGPTPAPAELQSDSLMFLGRNADQVVLYDFDLNHAIRAPIDLVVLDADS